MEIRVMLWFGPDSDPSGNVVNIVFCGRDEMAVRT